MAKEGSEIIPIGDIGAVVEQGNRDDELWVINSVTVAGVPYFNTYKLCLQCKARVEPHTECLGKCLKMDCIMMQRFDLGPQHITAKLMLLYEEDGQQRTVFAFAYGPSSEVMKVLWFWMLLRCQSSMMRHPTSWEISVEVFIITL